jgi:hypothetical protein
MSFLRRLFRDQAAGTPAEEPTDAAAGDPACDRAGAGLQAAEQAYERELLRSEAERLSSDLLQRQLRYADRSWTPPAQGGEERATLGGDAAPRN